MKRRKYILYIAAILLFPTIMIGQTQTPETQLLAFEHFVGTSTQEKENGVVQSLEWASKEKNALKWSVSRTVKGKILTLHEGIIGWDPAHKKIKLLKFYRAGFMFDGEVEIIENKAVRILMNGHYANGRVVPFRETWTPLGDNRYKSETEFFRDDKWQIYFNPNNPKEVARSTFKVAEGATSLSENNNSESTVNKDSQMKFFEYQIGKWEDDKELKMPDGRKYKFQYELEWFDRKKGIAKMHITGVFEDGEIRTFWAGFKHWSNAEKRMLYNGFSPDGRVANGYVEIGEKTITTHYGGETPNGKVLIRDVAEKIDENHFKTTTYLKQGSSDWRVVNRDSWKRVSNMNSKTIRNK